MSVDTDIVPMAQPVLGEAEERAVIEVLRSGQLSLGPRIPEFERRFAEAVNRLAADPELARRMGAAGRRRAVESFGWDAVARETVELYRSLG